MDENGKTKRRVAGLPVLGIEVESGEVSIGRYRASPAEAEEFAGKVLRLVAALKSLSGSQETYGNHMLVGDDIHEGK